MREEQKGTTRKVRDHDHDWMVEGVHAQPAHIDMVSVRSPVVDRSYDYIAALVDHHPLEC
jgi:hypothetical protein